MKRRLREGIEFFRVLREREFALQYKDDFGLAPEVNAAVELAHHDRRYPGTGALLNLGSSCMASS